MCRNNHACSANFDVRHVARVVSVFAAATAVAVLRQIATQTEGSYSCTHLPELLSVTSELD